MALSRQTPTAKLGITPANYPWGPPESARRASRAAHSRAGVTGNLRESFLFRCLLLSLLPAPGGLETFLGPCKAFEALKSFEALNDDGDDYDDGKFLRRTTD